MFSTPSPMKMLLAALARDARWRVNMQSTGPFQSQAQRQAPSPIHSPIQPRFGSSVKFIEAGPSNIGKPGEFELAGVSAAWRKLLLQAEMAGPHVQVASIEGESGVGKQTLARYLLSRSPLSAEVFHRHDAREWLLRDGDLATTSGFTYLDRIDLLAPPGQGLLLAVLKNLQDRPPGRALLIASSQTPLRHMAG